MADKSPLHPINLIRGWPNASLLPKQDMSNAAQQALADPTISSDALEYGPDEGFGPLRDSLGVLLTDFYNPPGGVGRERITISGGASQNLGCVLQVFTDPVYTRSVHIVAPAYMLSFRIFEDQGFAGRLKAVPEDEHGVDIAYLRSSLQKSDDAANIKNGEHSLPKSLKPNRTYSKYYRHIIYCVPTFSNPSSKTMSHSRRIDLVKCARDFDALIIADDVYDFLQWPATPSTVSPDPSFFTKATLPRLVDIDRDLDGGVERHGADGFGNAMSNGSFSKICGPGLRVGWCEGSSKFAYGVSQAGTSCSGGAPSQLASTFVDQLLRSGELVRHLELVLCKAYAQRFKILVDAIDEFLVPLGVSLPPKHGDVAGGFFVWVTLPRVIRAEELCQRCKDEMNVFVAPGSIFEVPGDEDVKFEHSMRLTFSWLEQDDMVEGVKRIRSIMESMLRGEKANCQVKSQKGLGQMK